MRFADAAGSWLVPALQVGAPWAAGAAAIAGLAAALVHPRSWPARLVLLENVTNIATALLIAAPAPPGTDGSGDVRLRAVHPVPPLNGRSSAWRDEIRGLNSWVQATDGPLVVSGDFNASAAHPPFRALCSGPNALAGCGPIFAPPTWSPRAWVPPVLPLDHILTRDLAVAERGVFAVSGSDHRGVWATIVPVSR